MLHEFRVTNWLTPNSIDDILWFSRVIPTVFVIDQVKFLGSTKFLLLFMAHFLFDFLKKYLRFMYKKWSLAVHPQMRWKQTRMKLKCLQSCWNGKKFQECYFKIFMYIWIYVCLLAFFSLFVFILNVLQIFLFIFPLLHIFSNNFFFVSTMKFCNVHSADTNNIIHFHGDVDTKFTVSKWTIQATCLQCTDVFMCAWVYDNVCMFYQVQ